MFKMEREHRILLLATVSLIIIFFIGANNLTGKLAKNNNIFTSINVSPEAVSHEEIIYIFADCCNHCCDE